MAIEKESLRLLNVLDSHRAAELHESLASWGIDAWRLDGSSAVTASRFFAAAGALPSPFSVRPVDDWDAFGDSLWELVALAAGGECALVWEHAESLLNANVRDFVEAVVALNSVARKLANPVSPGATPKLLYLFILGDGPNFRG